MRATTLLLSALMTASLQAQTFCKTEQFNLGQLLPTDSVSFKIEYPEYERLSRKTIDELRKQGFEAEDQVQFTSIVASVVARRLLTLPTLLL